MKNYDVCIIGAGPCGLTLALELSTKYKVCIVEAGREYQKRICPLDIKGICKENAEEFLEIYRGLGETIIETRNCPCRGQKHPRMCSWMPLPPMRAVFLFLRRRALPRWP